MCTKPPSGDDSMLIRSTWPLSQKDFDLTGLDALQMLTSRQQYELRVDLMMWNGTKGYATYNNFFISNSSDNYRLNFDSFTEGNAGDSLSYHRGCQFSTWDRNNDQWIYNCAQENQGAWWYRDCSSACLNGEYMPSSTAPVGC
ncbi:microfibril-associated glycoprotein 4-like [Littorina saxatilis]|uniref:microfibril-associated glycoprotein 4-like n=1 Tax=Littorina saxatilis TaxID=31220 RepID=UPI0038B4C13A